MSEKSDFCKENKQSMAVDFNDPASVARVLQVLADSNDRAVHIECILYALCMALARQSGAPFVSKSDVDIALNALTVGTVNPVAETCLKMLRGEPLLEAQDSLRSKLTVIDGGKTTE